MIGLESLDTCDKTVMSNIAVTWASNVLIGASVTLWSRGSWNAFSSTCMATSRSAKSSLGQREREREREREG